MAYGVLRNWWRSVSQLYLLSHFESLEREDRERRERAVSERLIIDNKIPPRRVWDLYSNRVVPYWVLGIEFNTERSIFRAHEILPVSHAWMSLDERKGVFTPINGYTWPVPVPADIRLDDLRIELLNLGSIKRVQYVWLDVLCLRQVGGKPQEESLRTKEWSIDVPTIGTIYLDCRFIVYYLNGLGRPFEENDLDDARHWCNRAWTLQEWCSLRSNHILSHPLLGGITEKSPHFNIARPNLYTDDHFTKRLGERIFTLDPSGSGLLTIIQAAAIMSRRQAERELDKLAGLAYFACGNTHPVFDETQHIEDAWWPFIDCMKLTARAQLFFMFPVAGKGEYKWMPSWNQL
ncbi:hypothetical protein PENSPDRAFT_570720, partial [Peniophora sp. CONT]